MSDDVTTVDDYGPGDSIHDSDGMDICARCNNRFRIASQPVFDSDGQEYESVVDTDPTDRTFFCLDCWETLQVNRRTSENKSLEAFK